MQAFLRCEGKNVFGGWFELYVYRGFRDKPFRRMLGPKYTATPAGTVVLI